MAHPDVESLKKKAQELFAAVGEAHRVLLEKSSRQAYLNDLTKREQSGGTAAPRRPPVRAEEAKLHSQKGKVYVQKKEYALAETEYKRATECDPALAEYKVEHAWAHALNPSLPEKERRTEALELLREIGKNSPRYADVYYKLGLLLRVMNENEKAEAHFRKTLDVDKKHEDAAKEVRVMELRAERKRAEQEEAARAAAQSKGGVMGLFKKK
jgi:tetratricopeptide (TPR) repeat protein